MWGRMGASAAHSQHAPRMPKNRPAAITVRPAFRQRLFALTAPPVLRLSSSDRLACSSASACAATALISSPMLSGICMPCRRPECSRGATLAFASPTSTAAAAASAGGLAVLTGAAPRPARLARGPPYARASGVVGNVVSSFRQGPTHESTYREADGICTVVDVIPARLSYTTLRFVTSGDRERCASRRRLEEAQGATVRRGPFWASQERESRSVRFGF